MPIGDVLFVRSFLILSVDLRQEYIVLFVMVGLLTCPVYCAFPTMRVSGQECNKHIVAQGLTAAGTVPDSHRIPVNPSSCMNSETINVGKDSVKK